MSRSSSQFAPMALAIMRHIVARGVQGCTVTEMCEAGTSYPTANNTRKDLHESGWITETQERRVLSGAKKGSVVYVATPKLVEFVQKEFGTETFAPMAENTVFEAEPTAIAGPLFIQPVPVPVAGASELLIENCSLRVSSALSLLRGLITKYEIDENDFGPLVTHLNKAEKNLGQM